MKKVALVALWLTTVPAFSFAQSDLAGFATSNYSGINGVDLNPAAISDNRFKIDAVVGGTQFGFSNNWFGLKREVVQPPYDESHPLNDSLFFDNFVVERVNDDPKSVRISNTNFLPSVMVSLSPKHAVGFTAQIRSVFTVDGISPTMATFIQEGLDFEPLQGQTFVNERLSLQTMSWAEYGGVYSRVIYDNGPFFLKAGGRLKLLQGLQAAYLYVNELTYNVSSDDTVAIINTDIEYGHSDDIDLTDGVFSYNFNFNNLSVGADLGVVFEWRPNHEDYMYEKTRENFAPRKDKNKYRLRVGASLLNMGSLKFTKGGESRNINANLDGWDVSDLDADLGDFGSIDSLFLSVFDVTEGEGQDFRMELPTAVSLQIDAQIWKDFYINITPYWAFQRETAPEKIADQTIYQITPRWDHKWFGAFLPLTFDDHRNTSFGAALRLGGLILGSRNLTPFFADSDIFNVDFFVMTKVPIPYGKPKDPKREKIDF